MRKYGLALDNLLSVDLVLADGRVVHAERERASGPVLGAARRRRQFRRRDLVRVSPAPGGPMVTGGLIALSVRARLGRAAVLPRYQLPRLPDELTVFGGLVHAPDGSGAKLAAIVLCHCGSLAEGEAAVQPIKAFGTPSWMRSARCRTRR